MKIWASLLYLVLFGLNSTLSDIGLTASSKFPFTLYNFVHYFVFSLSDLFLLVVSFSQSI